MIRAACIGLCFMLVSAVAFHFWRVAGLQGELATVVAAKEDFERQLSKAAIDALQRGIAATNETLTKRDADHDSIRDAGTVVHDNIAALPAAVQKDRADRQADIDAYMPAALTDELLGMHRAACAVGSDSGTGDAACSTIHAQTIAVAAKTADDAAYAGAMVGTSSGLGR